MRFRYHVLVKKKSSLIPPIFKRKRMSLVNISNWADNSSEEVDGPDTSRLLSGSVGGYQATEERVMLDHEEGLDKLGQVIKRQKYMAGELATEVELHNEILDGIDAGMTNTNENLQKNTRNVRLISKKSSSFFLWFLIVVLALVIVALAIL